jgi:hypothetical protein
MYNNVGLYVVVYLVLLVDNSKKEINSFSKRKGIGHLPVIVRHLD